MGVGGNQMVLGGWGHCRCTFKVLFSCVSIEKCVIVVVVQLMDPDGLWSVLDTMDAGGHQRSTGECWVVLWDTANTKSC